MTKILFAGALAATLVVTGVAMAATPTEIVTLRQSNFKQMGRAQKFVSDELKKPDANVNLIRAQARTLANFAPQITRWFPRGSGKESGAKTGALPVIWQQTPRFNAAAATFVNAVRNLERATAGGDLARVRAAVGAVGGACKGCHDTFKGDK